MLRYLDIGNNNFIPSYNLFVGFGIAMAMLFLQYQKPFKTKTDKEKHKIHLSLIVSILLGFIGAFIFDAYSQNIALTFDNLNQIGLTFLGGLISGLMILVICLKLASLQILPTLNILAMPFCIAHFFGRLGCFMAGCCFGSPTKSFLGVTFPIDSLPHNHYHELIKIHPTQLYESALQRFGRISTMIERDDHIPPLNDLITELGHAKQIASRMFSSAVNTTESVEV